MLTIAYFVLLGLIVGSAINAIVWRLYVGRSWVKGRSECPECGHRLGAKDLVPVASWLALGGKCRYCHKRIHWQYPAVEALTAGLFGLSAAVLLPPAATALDWIDLGMWLAALTMLIVLAVYDARWMLLPDKIMIPLIGLGLAMVVLEMVRHQNAMVAVGPLAAALVAGGGFYALVAATRGRAMGGGDIKLAFAMGLLLGLKATAVALFIAFNLAAIVGLAFIIAGRKKLRGARIAFGPFLVIGTVVAYLYGRDLLDWYLHLNGLM